MGSMQRHNRSYPAHASVSQLEWQASDGGAHRSKLWLTRATYPVPAIAPRSNQPVESESESDDSDSTKDPKPLCEKTKRESYYDSLVQRWNEYYAKKNLNAKYGTVQDDWIRRSRWSNPLARLQPPVTPLHCLTLESVKPIGGPLGPELRYHLNDLVGSELHEDTSRIDSRTSIMSRMFQLTFTEAEKEENVTRPEQETNPNVRQRKGSPIRQTTSLAFLDERKEQPTQDTTLKPQGDLGSGKLYVNLETLLQELWNLSLVEDSTIENDLLNKSEPKQAVKDRVKPFFINKVIPCTFQRAQPQNVISEKGRSVVLFGVLGDGYYNKQFKQLRLDESMRSSKSRSTFKADVKSTSVQTNAKDLMTKDSKMELSAQVRKDSAIQFKESVTSQPMSQNPRRINESEACSICVDNETETEDTDQSEDIVKTKESFVFAPPALGYPNPWRGGRTPFTLSGFQSFFDTREPWQVVGRSFPHLSLPSLHNTPKKNKRIEGMSCVKQGHITSETIEQQLMLNRNDSKLIYPLLYHCPRRGIPSCRGGYRFAKIAEARASQKYGSIQMQQIECIFQVDGI